MANRKTLELKRVGLDGRAEAHLITIATFGADDIAHFKREVVNGRTHCIGVFYDEKRVGTMLVTFLKEDEIICSCNALAVDNVPGFDPVPELISLVKVWAKGEGATLLRCWTKRLGLVAKMKKEGFTEQYVLEAQIHGR